ncbi:MAG: prepilin-type N-terminal cleavage/methylation domain-containing protein [bacterium]
MKSLIAHSHGVLSPRSLSGFTLIESLVALAILGVIVGVLVNVHLQTLRAESFSRLRESAVLEGETIVSQSLSGTERQAIVDQASREGWTVTATPTSNSIAGAVVYEWRVASSNAGAPAVTLYLRAGEERREDHAK